MASKLAGPTVTVLPPQTFSARRKAALNAVLAQVNASPQRPRSLKVFSVAPERDLLSSRHNPQIRAAGGPKFGGAEFRSFFGLGNAGPKRQADIVEHVLADARVFVRAAKSGRLTKPLQAARDLATRIPAGMALQSGAMNVAAIGLYPHNFGDAVHLTFDLEMLGDDLQLGIERVGGWQTEVPRLEAGLDKKIARHAELVQRKRELFAVGAICWIDEIALKITNEAGLTIADVIGLLSDRSKLELMYHRDGSAPLSCQIYWSGGVLRGVSGNAADVWRCSEGLMSVKGLDLPATLACAMPGRLLSSLFDHPLIPAEAVITNWHNLSHLISISIRVGAALVFASGVARRADGAVDWSPASGRLNQTLVESGLAAEEWRSMQMGAR